MKPINYPSIYRSFTLFLAVVFTMNAGCGKKEKREDGSLAPSNAASVAVTSRAGPKPLPSFPVEPPAGHPGVRLDQAGAPLIRSSIYDEDREVGKQLRGLNDDQQALLDVLRETLRRAENDHDRVEILEEIAAEDFRSVALFDIAREAIKSADPDVAVAALELIADFENPAALDVVRLAANDQDEFVRAAAVETLRYTRDPAVEEVLVRALEDWSGDVHQAVFNVLDTQPDEVKYPVLKAAAQGNAHYPAISAVVFSLHDSTKDAMAILISALDHPDEKVSDMASEAIFFHVGEDFSDSATASGWWAANQSRYTRDLMWKDGEGDEQ